MTKMDNLLPLRTPLCPAGHLPHKEGDYAGRTASTLSEP
jgi:hypothetical protein